MLLSDEGVRLSSHPFDQPGASFGVEIASEHGHTFWSGTSV